MNIMSTLPLTALLIAPLVGTSHAHPSLERREAHVGAPYKAVMRIPHGCEGSATTRVHAIGVPRSGTAFPPSWSTSPPLAWSSGTHTLVRWSGPRQPRNR